MYFHLADGFVNEYVCMPIVAMRHQPFDKASLIYAASKHDDYCAPELFCSTVFRRPNARLDKQGLCRMDFRKLDSEDLLEASGELLQLGIERPLETKDGTSCMSMTELGSYDFTKVNSLVLDALKPHEYEARSQLERANYLEEINLRKAQHAYIAVLREDLNDVVRHRVEARLAYCMRYDNAANALELLARAYSSTSDEMTKTYIDTIRAELEVIKSNSLDKASTRRIWRKRGFNNPSWLLATEDLEDLAAGESFAIFGATAKDRRNAACLVVGSFDEDGELYVDLAYEEESGQCTNAEDPVSKALAERTVFTSPELFRRVLLTTGERIRDEHEH